MTLRKRFFRLLASVNRAVLPKQWHRDLTRLSKPRQALAAVDIDVMVFLFGMFVVGQALVASGYLYCLADRCFGHIRSNDGLLLGVLLAAGLSAAILMNDTLAIIATPLMLRLSREHRVDPKLLLLALAFAVRSQP